MVHKQENLITNNKVKLVVLNGSEGPNYDPYSFTERKVLQGTQTIILHSGLVSWIKIIDTNKDGGPVQHIKPTEDDPYLNKAFVELTGMTAGEFDDSYYHKNTLRNVLAKAASQAI